MSDDPEFVYAVAEFVVLSLSLSLALCLVSAIAECVYAVAEFAAGVASSCVRGQDVKTLSLSLSLCVCVLSVCLCLCEAVPASRALSIFSFVYLSS